MNANNRQEGGSHYASEYQHWDFILDTGLSYLEGCATKYISRARKKNGQEDLKKAIHYVEKMIDRIEDVITYNVSQAVMLESIDRFCSANELNEKERLAIIAVCDWGTKEELSKAKTVLEELLVT